jgi:predicted adenine nucleotide alpha hydrolase (AANH) superfamily ATPase
MDILLHSCCGPCTVYPLKALREEGLNVEGFFYNPNIHPYREYLERLKSYKRFAELKHLQTHIEDVYGLELFINELKANQLSCQERCPLCYQLRLERTALRAKELGKDGFTTTLLVSPYQNHALLQALGKSIGEQYEIPFIYRDFRPGFRTAQQEARELGLYMQSYCGCIFSEYDRYKPKKKVHD